MSPQVVERMVASHLLEGTDMAEKAPTQTINDANENDGGGIPLGVPLDDGRATGPDATATAGEPPNGTGVSTGLDGDGLDPNDFDAASLARSDRSSDDATDGSENSDDGGYVGPIDPEVIAASERSTQPELDEDVTTLLGGDRPGIDQGPDFELGGPADPTDALLGPDDTPASTVTGDLLDVGAGSGRTVIDPSDPMGSLEPIRDFLKGGDGRKPIGWEEYIDGLDADGLQEEIEDAADYAEWGIDRYGHGPGWDAVANAADTLPGDDDIDVDDLFLPTDADGNLVDEDGDLVLDHEGNPIKIPSGSGTVTTAGNESGADGSDPGSEGASGSSSDEDGGSSGEDGGADANDGTGTKGGDESDGTEAEPDGTDAGTAEEAKGDETDAGTSEGAKGEGTDSYTEDGYFDGQNSALQGELRDLQPRSGPQGDTVDPHDADDGPIGADSTLDQFGSGAGLTNPDGTGRAAPPDLEDDRGHAVDPVDDDGTAVDAGVWTDVPDLTVGNDTIDLGLDEPGETFTLFDDRYLEADGGPESLDFAELDILE